MKPLKRILILLFLVSCSVSMVAPAFATGIQPFYIAVRRAEAKLNVSTNGQATCNIYVQTAQFSQYIEVNSELYRIGDNTETRVGFWSTGKEYMVSESKTYAVQKGYTYQLRSYVIVKNSSGGIIESFWRYSDVVYY